MKQQLFIPEKIKIGYVKREDTYTKKLAYIIYFDQKGVLRKEKSWEIWRDKKIDPEEFENNPTEGFVLNKGVGGGRHSYGWNARNEYIRVYDPRGFEFEISVANLLFILRECDCSKGKGLEGKFVYAWDGTELVLLPEISQDYQDSKNFTALQAQGVKAKDLIPGASYLTKRQESITYLGKFDYYFIVDKNSYKFNEKDSSGVIKKYVFWNEKNFVFLNELKSLAKLNSDTIASNYAELVDGYNKSEHGSKVVKLFTRKEGGKEGYWHYEQDGVFIQCATQYDYVNKDKIIHVHSYYKFSLKDGVLTRENYSGICYAEGHRKFDYGYNRQISLPWVEPTNDRLYALLESGTEIKMEYNTFAKG